MPKLFQRSKVGAGDGDTEKAETPRRSTALARKGAAAAKPSKAPARTSEASEGARKRSRPTRRRKPAAAPVAAAPAAATPAAGDGAGGGDLADLLQHQSTLIEKQTGLLQSLVAAQERGVKSMERLAGSSTAINAIRPEVDGLALEVKPRLALFVDVPNILYGAERSGVTLDWGKVADFVSRGRTLVRAVAYAPISDDPAARIENERFVVPFLDEGYRIVTKPLKRFAGGSVKANFDVELAIDILTMADRLDVITLASGDGDFRRLVEIVGSRGVRVEVIAFGHSTSGDLRGVADRYIDIAAYVPDLCK